MEIRVRHLTNSKLFWMTLLLLAAANLASWLIKPACCDQIDSVGFPFAFMISGGITGSSNFYLLGALLNVFVALTIATLFVWIARSIANRE